MSILNRIQQAKVQTDSDQDQLTTGLSHSTILARADSPVIHRIRLIFTETRNRADIQGKMGWVLQSVMDEVLDTLAEEDNEEDLQKWLLISAALMRWTATGDMGDLPEEFRARAMAAEQQLQLPAEDAMIAHK
jgi:hypothetical protein